MFGEAIKVVNEAEAAARTMRGEAARRAKQVIEEANLAGEAKLREANQRAETECAEMLQAAEARATREAQDLASNTENKKAALGARAETVMGKAVELIIGRIVNA